MTALEAASLPTSGELGVNNPKSGYSKSEIPEASQHDHRPACAAAFLPTGVGDGQALDSTVPQNESEV